MSQTENIATQIKRKNANGFDTPFFIGSASKFITGVRGSNVNNIEENFLVGFDKIVMIENLGDGVLHTVEEFRNEDVETDYYFLDIYEYNNYSTERRWFFNEKLFLPTDMSDNKYDTEAEMLEALNQDVYSYDAEDERFRIDNVEDPVTPVICSATLKFKDSEGVVTDIVIKKIYAKYKDSQGVIRQKQTIQNLL